MTHSHGSYERCGLPDWVVDEAAEWTRRAREQEDPEKVAAAKAFIAVYEAAKSSPEATEAFINKYCAPQPQPHTAVGQNKAIIIAVLAAAGAGLLAMIWHLFNR